MTKQTFLRRIIAEPLLHFLLIGAALFCFYQWQAPSADAGTKAIKVTTADVSRLVSGFERTWQRPPTVSEMGALIESFVREEIYYREAKALGLDQDDVVVRRRLQQKLEFVLEDFSGQLEPSDEQLAAFMAEQPEKYRFEPKFTFRQIYFNLARHGEELDGELTRLLTQMNKGDQSDRRLEDQGDASLLPRLVNRWSRSAVDASFGEEFVTQLETLESGLWSGPIHSSLGVHLVQLAEHQPARLPLLAEIRESVRSDWLTQQRAQLAEKSYRNLRERYRVEVEGAALASQPHTCTATVQ